MCETRVLSASSSEKVGKKMEGRGDVESSSAKKERQTTTVTSNTISSLPLLLERKTWEDFVFRTPCVKSSYLLGLGCGSTMIAHKLHLYRGQLNRAVRAGLFTFIFASTVSFLICAKEVNAKYASLQQAFKQKNIRESQKGEKKKEG